MLSNVTKELMLPVSIRRRVPSPLFKIPFLIQSTHPPRKGTKYTCNTATGVSAGVGLGAGEASVVLTLLLDTDALQHGQGRAACSSTVSATPQATHVTTPNNWYRCPPAQSEPDNPLLHCICHNTGHKCFYTRQLVQMPSITGKAAPLSPPQYLPHHRPHMLLHPTIGTDALQHSRNQTTRSSIVSATTQVTYVSTPDNWYRCPPSWARPHRSLLHSTCHTTGHICYYTQQVVQTPSTMG